MGSQPPLVWFLGRLVDCNRSGYDREGDIDWHMSYTVTVGSFNPTQSNGYLGRLVDCNRSGYDREGAMDWHRSYMYTVMVRSLNPSSKQKRSWYKILPLFTQQLWVPGECQC